MNANFSNWSLKYLSRYLHARNLRAIKPRLQMTETFIIATKLNTGLMKIGQNIPGYISSYIVVYTGWPEKRPELSDGVMQQSR